MRCSTAYTYGFWPYVPPKRGVLLEIPSKLLQLQGGSIRLGGSRGPVNIGFYPRAWQLPADADDTACVWAALMEHTSTESNTHSPPHLCEVFADWRDIGTDKLRNRQEWRAYRCGDVLDLMPSIKAITTDLTDTAHWAKGGICHWGDGDRFLDTAFACSTLLMLGYEGPEIDAGMTYLLSGQDPVTGAWPAEAFCIGKFPYGDRLTWQSSALTTAMAVEAICRWKDRGLHNAD